MGADIAASQGSIPHNAGKGLTEANPSPYRASDTVSGWAIWEPSHRVQPYGKDRPGEASLRLLRASIIPLRFRISSSERREKHPVLSAANHDTCLDVAKIAHVFGNDHLIAPADGKAKVFEHVTSGAAAKIFGGSGYCGWIKALQLG